MNLTVLNSLGNPKMIMDPLRKRWSSAKVLVAETMLSRRQVNSSNRELTNTLPEDYRVQRALDFSHKKLLGKNSSVYPSYETPPSSEDTTVLEKKSCKNPTFFSSRAEIGTRPSVEEGIAGMKRPQYRIDYGCVNLGLKEPCRFHLS